MTENNVTTLRPKRDCPQCNKPATRDVYPFCSKRCADLDLGSWLNGNYRIAARSTDESDFSSTHGAGDQDQLEDEL